MARFFCESDGGLYYIIDREASPLCKERGYKGQIGRDRTDLDIYALGYLTLVESRRLAKKLCAKWNANPPWPACK